MPRRPLPPRTLIHWPRHGGGSPPLVGNPRVPRFRFMSSLTKGLRTSCKSFPYHLKWLLGEELSCQPGPKGTEQDSIAQCSVCGHFEALFPASWKNREMLPAVQRRLGNRHPAHYGDRRRHNGRRSTKALVSEFSEISSRMLDDRNLPNRQWLRLFFVIITMPFEGNERNLTPGEQLANSCKKPRKICSWFSLRFFPHRGPARGQPPSFFSRPDQGILTGSAKSIVMAHCHEQFFPAHSPS